MTKTEISGIIHWHLRKEKINLAVKVTSGDKE